MKCCRVLLPPPLVGLILPSPQPKPSSHGNEWHVRSPPGSHHPTPGLSRTLSHGNPSVPSHGALPLTRGSHAVGRGTESAQWSPCRRQGHWEQLWEAKTHCLPLVFNSLGQGGRAIVWRAIQQIGPPCFIHSFHPAFWWHLE